VIEIALTIMLWALALALAGVCFFVFGGCIWMLVQVVRQ